MDLVGGADAKTLVICLLSGGASSLLVAPARGITLEDKILTTDLLLASGADIAEVNTVRKHLSAVKGGQLAAQARPARVLTLALSDVIGDRLDVIGSGPTFPDASTFSDAREVLGRRGLLKRVPLAVRTRLERGALCVIPETPKPGDPLFDGVGHCIVGSNRIALDAAAASARAQGYDTVVLSAEVQGEAREAARWLAAEVRQVAQGLSAGAPPVCLLCGGETTVTVTGPGQGGRNMEFALAFALAIEDLEGVDFLSAGTDGTDGPTDAAGAFVDGGTASLARGARVGSGSQPPGKRQLPVLRRTRQAHRRLPASRDRPHGDQCHGHPGGHCATGGGLHPWLTQTTPTSSSASPATTAPTPSGTLSQPWISGCQSISRSRRRSSSTPTAAPRTGRRTWSAAPGPNAARCC